MLAGVGYLLLGVSWYVLISLTPSEQEEYLRNLRRDRIQSLMCASPSVSQTQIAKTLSLPLSTVHDDVVFLKKKASEYVKTFDEHFSQEYMNCLTMLGMLQQDAWVALKNCKYERNRGQLTNVLREIVMNRAALICDVNLVGRTVEYVTQLKERQSHLLGLPVVEDALSAVAAAVDTAVDAPIDVSVEDGDEQDGEGDNIIEEKEGQDVGTAEGEQY